MRLFHVFLTVFSCFYLAIIDCEGKLVILLKNGCHGFIRISCQALTKLPGFDLGFLEF